MKQTSLSGHSESASLLPRVHLLRKCPPVCQNTPSNIFDSYFSIHFPLSTLFGQAFDLLVTVSYTRYRASTSALST